MLTLTIKNMSCGHCVGQINRAITALDPDALVTADIANHQISVKSAQSNQDILAALDDIGYPATVE